ncbi:imm11 family protein [Cyclobacterium marinum]|uniref:imm11 family protein n=1 Tax=Cyclobacterium marinum TaxID=104 RepID=UPI0011EC4942|nr:DUF1629 domain-containing protein [Cyclobacterium marinum]MBI0400765.1 hypothetical protein [Cyclobacterium marinum]
MNFWTIGVDSDSKDVGKVFPQVHCLTQAHAHRLSCHEMPDFEPKLEFILEPKAKFSDIISDASISASGLLISEKFKNVLKDFNIGNHKYFTAKIKDQKEEIEQTYYWLHLYNPKTTDWINYKCSKFYYTEYGFRAGDVEIDSFADSRKKKNELVGNMGTIEADKIVLNENFDKSIDLFALEYFDYNVHISERLRIKILESKLKGIKWDKSICG